MPLQKTKLYHDLSRFVSRARPGDRPAQSAAPNAPMAPATSTSSAADAGRGSRILRIAEFASQEARAAVAPATCRAPALAQTRLQPIEDLLAAARDEDQDVEDLRVTTVMKGRAAPVAVAYPRKLGPGPRSLQSRHRRLLVGVGLVVLVVLVVGALVALGELGVDTVPRVDEAHTQDRSHGPKVGLPLPPAGEPSKEMDPIAAVPEPGVIAEVAERGSDSERPTPSVGRQKRGTSAPTPAGDPLERTAVDALASGDYPRAIKSYEALAARHPDQVVYAEAARVLRQRAGLQQP